MRRLGRLIGVWLRSHRLDDDLAAELEDHRLRKQEALERMGMPSEEAAYAARRALGNVTLAREDARSVWIRSWFESMRSRSHPASFSGLPRRCTAPGAVSGTH